MCKKLKWFLCSHCEEYETQLDPCDIDEDDEVICNYCFAELDPEFSAIYTQCLKEAKEKYPDLKEAKIRRKK